jgi:hypothetical protein
MVTFDYPACNPFGGNPFRGRADVELALKNLVAPLEKHRSPGGARIRLSAWQGHFEPEAADFEGYARPLWGLVPAQAGGADWIDWRPIRNGLAAGTDPDHPEYWGVPGDYDQRLVELAVIGLALCLVPEQIWQPLSAKEKERALAYFLAARQRLYVNCNWKFFRLTLDLGLAAVGAPADRAGNRAAAEDIERWYQGEGWYADGGSGAVDHYAAFAFHFFGLILAQLDTSNRDYGTRYRERARQSITDITRWFADDGPVLAFGRSMTYRFASVGYIGAFAFANEEAMPWGILKGFYLRHLRWWAKLPIARADGILDIGYGYPNAMISESYNSPQSPYWALKAFLPLALPPAHPFWTAEEASCPERPRPSGLKHASMIIANPPGDAIALAAAPATVDARHEHEKYRKFAYSARYGFSIESDLRRFDQAVLDNSLGFSEDGRYFRVREKTEASHLVDETLCCLWHPYPDIRVESWLWWHGAFHVRVHRVTTPAPIMTIEGGFAIKAERAADARKTLDKDRAGVETAADHSAIIDLGSTVPRRVRLHRAPPNTNLVAPKTLVPQLFAQLPAGTTVLACAVIAQGNPEAVRAALADPPPKPDLAHLETLFPAPQ